MAHDIHGMLQAEGDVRHAVTNLQQELQQLKEVRQCRAEQQKQQVSSSLCSKIQTTSWVLGQIQIVCMSAAALRRFS